MTRYELEVEHSYQNKFLGRHIIRETSEVTVVGTSREAIIRLLGEDVSPIHAIIELDAGHWVVTDLNSEIGTWVRNQKIVQHAIKKTTLVTIGEHVLKLTPKVINPSLFTSTENKLAENSENTEMFHQVVLRKRNFVVETVLLDAKKPYIYVDNGSVKTIHPPKDNSWNTHKFGDVEVQNRLVSAEHINFRVGDKIKSFIDPSLKGPMGGAFALIFLLTMLFLFSGPRTEELVEQKKPQHKYTKMFFNSKNVKKRKARAKKMQTKITASSPKSSAGAKKIKTTAPKKSKTVVKVVSRLKASGLTKLISKIAKRASSTSRLVESRGKKAGSGPSSRAMASVGKSSLGSPNAKTGKSFKVAGVSTVGKGGGSGSYRGAAGLAVGGIGGADVGILEEETVIEGGLARDVISRTIAGYLGQIRHCYERQLAANPDLYGKVMVKFTINGKGGVTTKSVGSSTLNNSMVEGCMLRKVARWKFPKPKGGTSVLVTYPFLFKSTQ